MLPCEITRIARNLPSLGTTPIATSYDSQSGKLAFYLSLTFSTVAVSNAGGEMIRTHSSRKAAIILMKIRVYYLKLWNIYMQCIYLIIRNNQ